MKPLAGRIALVAGATRGAGRGIAAMLGEAGATVYCSGRSVRGSTAMQGRPEAIEDTAEVVTARGGIGLWAQADHTDDEQVRRLVDRIREEQGRLDILVNDIWGGDELTEWGKPFWELSPEMGLRMLERGIHTHILTSRWAVPLMLEGDRGLVVEITDGSRYFYRGNLYYDLVKTSVIRLAYAMAVELRDHGITALAVTPGFLRSEMVLEHMGVDEETWRQGAARDPHFAYSESPCFIGRAIAALAADPQIQVRAGRPWSTWELARDYGFRDLDGSRPDWGAHLRSAIGDVMARAAAGLGPAPQGEAPASAIERARQAVSAELETSGLQFLGPSISEVWYRRLLAGAADQAGAFDQLVEETFG